METSVWKSLRVMACVGLLLSGIFPNVSFAVVSGDTIANFTSVPINLTDNDVTPLVMLNASKDHQLFFKAYNDYSDFDGDGLADTTYKHSVTYYGYFDSSKCYNYNSAVGVTRFEPKGNADAQNYCTGGNAAYWSGNFLNWISMSRIDVIRKILFGGHRRVDTSTTTVLERAYLPHDAHSWAKYYAGSDLDKLTPFTNGGEYTLVDADPKKNGITFCNTTDVDMDNYGNNTYSEDYTEPPLIKAVKGNYSLWAGQERWQCTWGANAPYDNHSENNSNVAASSGINAYTSSPDYSTQGIGQKNYVARVQVCVPGLIGNERCKLYPGPDGIAGNADDNYKPIGLLQVYGDENQMHFGMMAGTYNKHTSGGELIRNMGSMTDEIDVNKTGIFTKVAATAGGPIAHPYNDAYGLINAWSLYRIIGYNGDDGTYNDGDNCDWGLSAVADITSDNRCKNWGNPFAEIFLQSIRYFAKEGVTGQFRSNASTGIPGLPTPSAWNDPISTSNYCARLNVINLNSSIFSFDHDELDGNSYGVQTIWDAADLPGDDTSKAMTDVIGASALENIHGNSYFVGESNVSSQVDADNQICTAKIVSSLGNAGGPCPEAPRLQGSYRVAGLAYYAHIKDIRPPSAGINARTGTQKVDTYSVAMATAVPAIEIPHPVTGVKAVTIMPACRNTSLTPNGNCTIVDFKIVSQNIAAGTGKFYINWEDSEQGGDYDQDMWGTLEYTINAGAGTIAIRTQVIAQSASNKMGFGYVISGTTNDGFHVHSGINGFAFAEAADAGNHCADGDGCICRPSPPVTFGACTVDGSSTKNYTLGAAGASLLKDPLWYASKWGGFIDSNGNNIPDVQSEWDKVNNTTGAPGADGTPDTYFYANNPSQLEDSLNRVFLAILQRASSGTAAAVVANNVSGIGALYQAYYEPLRQDTMGREASWLGTVQSLWLDSYGYVREDDGDAKLENYNTDRVIQLFYDDVENKTRVRRYISTKDDEFAPYYMQGAVTAYDAATGIVTFSVDEISGAVGVGPFTDWTVYNLTASTTGSSVSSATMTAVGGTQTFAVTPATAWISIGDTVMVAHFDSTIAELADLGTLWNARKQLSFSGADASVQRSFATKADGAVNGGRFIKTWIDDGDSAVEAGEFVDFAKTVISPANFGFFNLATEAEAENLTDYVRGKEIAGYRNRTIDYDENGTTEVMRLADVVNSTPTVVGSPQESFDLLYKDASYAEFKKQYANRRQVLYVGSNGGMLHALNGGFYDSAQKAFLVSGEKHDGTPVVEHPLGAEIWAYVPMNLLPHLKWLKEPNYTHVYYMDGKPKVFDAKIFDPTDDDHPGGWGTVLVVGMRFGGGPMTIDTAADGLAGDLTPDDNRVLRSAYIIMDITNPEAEPQLLAEVQVPHSSYSTSYPAVITVKDKDSALDANKWFLVFGSGPTSLASAESTMTAKIYAFDLGEIASPGSSLIVGALPAGCTQLAAGTGGSMKILSCDTNVANSFVGDPISVDWDLDYKADSVYFGVVGSKIATSGQVMRLGVNEKESPKDWASLATLIDTEQPVSAGVTPGVDESGQKWIFFGTGRFFVSEDQATTATQSIYGVKEAGSTVDKGDLLNVSSAQVGTDGSLTGVGAIATVAALRDTITSSYDGWYLNLPPIEGVAGTAPATRVINSSALAGGVLFTTAYQPGVDACSGEGFSRLYGLYYKTGTAYSSPTVFGTQTIAGVEYSKAFIELGYGFATTPSLHTGSGTGDDAVSVFTQLSTGAIVRTEASTVTGVRSGLESWIEFR